MPGIKAKVLFRWIARQAAGMLCLAVLCLVLLPGFVLAPDASATKAEDALLLAAGMPPQEVERLDPDFKAYIVEDLSVDGWPEGLCYQPAEKVGDAYTGGPDIFNLELTAFLAGDTYYLYPSYVFTIPVSPSGNDQLILRFDNAFAAFDFGGQVWYREQEVADWVVYGGLDTTSLDFASCGFSGNQLGAGKGCAFFKGCAAIRAACTSSNTVKPRLEFRYLHDPGWNGNIILQWWPLRIRIPSELGSASIAQTFCLCE